jgi:pantothenate synthetase
MDETNAKRAIEIVKEQIQQESSIQIDYLVIVDPNTLLEKETIAKNDRILFAGYLGKTRLIDNMAF